MQDTLFVSASQITKYHECQRQWAFNVLARIDEPDTAAAALGKEVDDQQLQPYLRDRRPFDFTRPSGYIAASGLEFLPYPETPGLEVQKKFTMPSPSGLVRGGRAKFGYLGYIDLWLPNNQNLDPYFPLESEVPCVIDFKTTK